MEYSTTLLLASLLCLPMSSEASIVHIKVTGITSEAGPSTALGLETLIPYGSLFVAEAVYDSNALPYSTGTYPPIGQQSSYHGGSLNITVGGVSIFAPTTEVTVGNNASSNYDTIGVFVPGPVVATGTPVPARFFGFGIADTNGFALASDALPTTLDFAAFDHSNFAVFFIVGSEQYVVSGVLSSATLSVEAAPEPEIFGLLLAGALAMPLLRKRNKSASPSSIARREISKFTTGSLWRVPN